MKRITKRISAVFLALALTLTMVPAAVQASPELSVPKSVTVYRETKNSGHVSFSVSGLNAKQSISKASVKSSNTKVAAPNSISHDSWSYKTEYFDKGQNGYEDIGKTVRMSFNSQKLGTSTVSYKIGSKTYKTKVTVLKYTNPVKSLTIPGIKGNQAGKFKNGCYAETKMSSSTKGIGKVTLNAASGWKIRNVGLYNKDYSLSRSVSCYEKPQSSLTLYTGAMKKGAGYRVNASMVNTKTGGELSVSLYIDC